MAFSEKYFFLCICRAMFLFLFLFFVAYFGRSISLFLHTSVVQYCVERNEMPTNTFFPLISRLIQLRVFRREEKTAAVINENDI
jgi:hypothetical protein